VSRLILVEDDLEIAPDFFSYFEATAPLLRSDPSLWCISAWNDHGQAGRASDNKALYRTDIMPGLGWMLANDTAHYLLIMWPTGMCMDASG
jgi:alpha-1,3-mannosyl-glycoprotein beta-1,2-N-acetylglucosaminyltransferase